MIILLVQYPVAPPQVGHTDQAHAACKACGANTLAGKDVGSLSSGPRDTNCNFLLQLDTIIAIDYIFKLMVKVNIYIIFTFSSKDNKGAIGSLFNFTEYFLYLLKE